MDTDILPVEKKENILNKRISFREIIFIIIFLGCLTPIVSAPVALLLGLIVAQLTGNPFTRLNHKLTQILLQVSVVGLGFGMNVQSALQAGKQGFSFTVISICCTLLTGILLGKLLKIDRKISTLISVGTAICGGSAIAAVSPVIKAEEKQISIALGTIFLLNSIALFIFPWIGSQLHLSQTQFGIWSAIAIQDTSSVVGAASKFGPEALQIATTVKLTRALWIIPVAIIASFIFKSNNAKIKIPYFIGLFVVAILLNTYIEPIHKFSPYILFISKAGLTATLFLIGSGLSKNVLNSVGFKPVLQGIILWILIAVPALMAVMLTV